jgi:hypothetical protein
VSVKYYTYIVPYDLWFATTLVNNFQVGSVFGVSVALILQFYEIILLTMVTRDKIYNIQVVMQHTSCYYVNEEIN